jgi:hypothetical protein
MKEFIEFIVKHLVDKTESVVIEDNYSEENKTTYLKLNVATDDIGKVIGKKGKNIQAIRTLLAAVSAKHSKHYTLEIIDRNEKKNTA